MKRQEERTALLFIAPNFIGFFIFFVLPLVFAFYLSFNRWDMLSPAQWRGLQNYVQLLGSDTFWLSLTNNLVFAAITVPVCVVVSLVVANGLNKDVVGRDVLRTIYFLPYITTITAVAAVWIWIYHPTGPINSVLGAVGFKEPPVWLLRRWTVIPALASINAWRGIGYATLIYLAALQGIPDELYESAKIDGAGSTRVFLSITVPLLAPTTFFIAVVRTIQAFKSFDLIWAVTQGGPGRQSYMLVYYVYTRAFTDFRMGSASAIAIVLLLIVFTITALQWKGQKRWARA